MLGATRVEPETRPEWHDDVVPDHTFFSDRLNGPRPATESVLPSNTSQGLLGLINNRINSNRFAQAFPEQCPDGDGVCGTDIGVLHADLQAIVPGAPWPLLDRDARFTDEVVFDLIEYAATSISKPVDSRYHPFMRHYELAFKKKEGRAEFRKKVNTILQRGGAMFELRENGEVHRRGPFEVEAVLGSLTPASGDPALDALIDQARTLYTSHRPGERTMALERLWDAFERLKTIDLPGGDKKQSVQMLLGSVDRAWGDKIETEMKVLTQIGNDFAIRHHETRTTPVPADSGEDYLFTRLGALITLLLTSSGRMSNGADDDFL